MILYNILGGICGTSIFWATVFICETCTHDGRGRTLRGHVDACVLFVAGSVASFIVGSWLAPALLL